MGEATGISWCHHTFNPWWGCVEVTAACDFCYARVWAHRMGFDVWGADASRRFFGEAHWNEPLKWNRAAAKAGERRRVFCASMADVFERHANGDSNRNLNDERIRLWRLIEATPNLDWLLLTKRPQNVVEMVPSAWHLDGFPHNVWMGFTAEGQREFDIRWRDMKISTPSASVVFVSYEPALGPLVLPADYLALGPRAWVIGGGESGSQARPAHPQWFRDVRAQCIAAGVPFHFKQWGEWTPGENVSATRGVVTVADMSMGRWFFHDENLADAEGHHDDEPLLYRIGKKAAGHALDGETWRQFPSPCSLDKKGTVA